MREYAENKKLLEKLEKERIEKISYNINDHKEYIPDAFIIDKIASNIEKSHFGNVNFEYFNEL